MEIHNSIFEPIKVDEVWRIRTNTVIKELFNYTAITKAGKLSSSKGRGKRSLEITGRSRGKLG